MQAVVSDGSCRREMPLAKIRGEIKIGESDGVEKGGERV